MEKHSALLIFESLSSGLRLDVYRLLVRKGMEGMVAGEIATTLDCQRLRPNGANASARKGFHAPAVDHGGMRLTGQGFSKALKGTFEENVIGV